MANKEVQELRDRIHREGYDTRVAKDGHIEVLDYQGAPVRHKSGKPLRFGQTPSDHRALANNVSMLRDAGVLPKQTQGKPIKRVNGSQRDAMKLHRDVLKQYSDELRKEVVRLMEEGSLTQADIYHFADRWAVAHNIPVPGFPQGVMSKFLGGKSLSNQSYGWLTAAVSAIRRNEGKIPDAPQVTRPDQTEQEVPAVETHVPTALPELAFEVMQAIYKEEKDHDAIMAMVLRIARLEQE